MRLIDADDLKRQLEEGVWNSAVEEVDNQPTAYDLEAVVRELEAKSTFYTHEAEEDKDIGHAYLATRKYGISDGLDIAIEIVKRGGRNE